ncbi:MAG: hypothetical protein MJ178_02905 [Treponemataceae bacterium]|nr:hypothetical protein [Treponemataceae bacterium]
MTRPESILQWRGALSTLADHHFFDIIRMYLGEIKTPYNKQKLIEDLSVFLRKPETKQNIVAMMTTHEIEIVTAIHLFNAPTPEKLSRLFAAEESYGELFEELMNLEERLIIYRYKNTITGHMEFAVNPHLIETLEPLLTRESIFPEAKVVASAESDSVTLPAQNEAMLQLTPELLVAMLSFVADNPDLCKNDGAFKKKIETILPVVFPQVRNIRGLELLVQSLTNLGLMWKTDSGYALQNQRIQRFAQLAEPMQYAYIAASASGLLPRDVLQKQAQLIADIICSIPQRGYSKEVMLRNAYYLQNESAVHSGGEQRTGRFAALLRQANARTTEKSIDSLLYVTPETSELIQHAIDFGLLRCNGVTEEGKAVFVPGGIFAADPHESYPSVSIDSGFGITVLPGMSFRELLPVFQIAVPVKYDTILQMELSKKAVIRAFDAGCTPQQLQSDLQNVVNHELPQNLQFSFEDWYTSYTSASLFRGYILKILPEKELLVEKNPEFAPYIQMKIGPGIFLLNFASNQEANGVIAASGLDFIGQVHELHGVQESLPFAQVRISYRPPMSVPAPETTVSAGVAVTPFTEKERETFVAELKQTVLDKQLSTEQENELLSRIDRRIVVSASQLRADSVRPERMEASGMDFLGKVHVIEHALASTTLLQVTLDGVMELVEPVMLTKDDGDTMLKARTVPGGEEKTYSVARCQKIKRIRGAIFKETEY